MTCNNKFCNCESCDPKKYKCSCDGSKTCTCLPKSTSCCCNS